MSVVYFVSDIHIRDMKEQKAQTLLRFLYFLKEQKEPTVLILGGDIFDLWLGGHQYFVKKYAPLIEVLRALTDLNHEVYYFEGNHDLHLKSFWEKKVGAKVYTAPEFFLFDKTLVRFEHGDQMDPEDYGYHFLRWLLRTPVFTFLIVNLPAFVVAYVGAGASRVSRNYTNHLRDELRIQKILHHYAEASFDQRPFDLFVHGHVHLEDEYVFERNKKNVTSINLGSWDLTQKVLVLKGNQWFWKNLFDSNSLT